MLEYKLFIVTLAGTLLTTFTPKPEPNLGVRCVAWHPSGVFVAVGGYDDKVRPLLALLSSCLRAQIYILDTLSWSPVITFEYTSRIPAGVTIWQEPQKWLEATEGGRGFLSCTCKHETINTYILTPCSCRRTNKISPIHIPPPSEI